MKLQSTRRFERAYKELSDEAAVLVRKALMLLATDSRHPGLHVKKIQGTDDIWEARAGRSIRLTFEIHDDVIVLRNVGPHDETLKKP
jgi:mRNA-degrading endonuclease RelE of RelBE toxin-antitoxin system